MPGDERRRDVAPGTLAFGFRADLDRGGFLPARSAEPLRSDPNGPRGLRRPGRLGALLAEELRDLHLLGGLRDRILGLDVDLVANGLGEVVGSGLDGLDVGCLLGDLGPALLDQLGDARLLPRRGGRRSRRPRRRSEPSVLFVVALGLGLQQERADPVPSRSPASSASPAGAVGRGAPASRLVEQLVGGRLRPHRRHASAAGSAISSSGCVSNAIVDRRAGSGSRSASGCSRGAGAGSGCAALPSPGSDDSGQSTSWIGAKNLSRSSNRSSPSVRSSSSGTLRSP